MPKKIPLRMCIVCREMMPKSELLRLVKNDEGVHFDKSGKLNGRGAYICKNPDCFSKCINKKFLERAFECQISKENYVALQEEYAELTKNQ